MEQEFEEITGISHLKKVLCHSDFIVQEFPGILLKFMPEGTLLVTGQGKIPIKHYYELMHTPDNFILKTSPHLLQESFDMVVKYMKNHIILIGVKQDENGEPLETLNLTRLKLRAF